MEYLRINGEWCFSESEEKRIDNTATELCNVLKKNNLTYIEAVECLNRCEVLTKQSLIK